MYRNNSFKEIRNDILIQPPHLSTHPIVEREIAIQSYNNILRRLNILLQELNMTEDLRRFYSLYMILNNGYLSVNRKFVKKPVEDKILYDKDMGKVLMTGFGVCRNTQFFYIDFLDSMKIKSLYISGELCDIDKPTGASKHSLVMRELHDENGNSRYILYDLINHYIFELLKDFNVYSYDDEKFIISEDSKYSILYEGYYDYEEIRTNLNKNISPFYDKNLLPIIQDEVVDAIYANEGLLDDFYSENYYDINVVANFINKTLKLK